MRKMFDTIMVNSNSIDNIILCIINIYVAIIFSLEIMYFHFKYKNEYKKLIWVYSALFSLLCYIILSIKWIVDAEWVNITNNVDIMWSMFEGILFISLTKLIRFLR